ncbi:Uncharacterised protein [Mycobacteroides abscessus subsp. abscessus]|nr:Uncharacterised protein [Mycobacteroides abscessus subsp. abscessus]
MFRNMPCTPSFFVYFDTHSAVDISSSGSPESLRAAPIPLTSLAPWRVNLLSRNPHPPPVTSMSLPPIRYRIGGVGSRISNRAPTSRHVCSVIPPTSITIAPLLTLKPSISSVDARPPTLSSRSTTRVRYPCRVSRAAANKPPAPAPITTASKCCSVMSTHFPTIVDSSVRPRQPQRCLGHVVENHLSAHRRSAHKPCDKP